MAHIAPASNADDRVHQAANLLGCSPEAVLDFVRQQHRQRSSRSSLDRLPRLPPEEYVSDASIGTTNLGVYGNRDGHLLQPQEADSTSRTSAQIRTPQATIQQLWATQERFYDWPGFDQTPINFDSQTSPFDFDLAEYPVAKSSSDRHINPIDFDPASCSDIYEATGFYGPFDAAAVQIYPPSSISALEPSSASFFKPSTHGQLQQSLSTATAHLRFNPAESLLNSNTTLLPTASSEFSIPSHAADDFFRQPERVDETVNILSAASHTQNTSSFSNENTALMSPDSFVVTIPSGSANVSSLQPEQINDTLNILSAGSSLQNSSSFSESSTALVPANAFVVTIPSDATDYPSSLSEQVDKTIKILSAGSNMQVASAHPKLAPMPLNRRLRGGNTSNDRNSTQSLTSTMPRKRRQPYSKERRLTTHRTRELVSCIRCRTQRIRCKPNPKDENLPCLTCLKSNPRTIFLGCLRYKISQSVLFRTGVGPYTFYQNHPMTGPDYGDFRLQANRKWAGNKVHVLEITQDIGSVCRLEVRQFDPPEEIDAVDLKGRSMYHIPWAIADPDKATDAFNKFLDESLIPYLNSLLDESDELVWEVFHSAISVAFSSNEPAELLQDVLRLWVACRFIEGKWRCCGSDTLGAGELKNPFRSPDWISPPPYIDYQYASIIMHRILTPLRLSVLGSLQKLINENQPKNWYTIFLVAFILLHNYERGVTFQRAFWAKRKSQLLYLDMSLIRAMHSGAKTILAYFHWSCKGNIPFTQDFDWSSGDTRRMSELDEQQISFLSRLSNLARQKADEMRDTNQSHNYESPYWFTSQIFEERWKPRETYEHSPPAQPWPPAPIFGPARPQ